MADNQNLILETKHWRVLVAYDQEILGRCIVLCKDEVSEMGKLSSEQWLDFAQVAQQLEAASKKAFGATMSNWTCLMNNAFQHNPPDPRVHWHFRPRYKQAVQFAGLTFEDKEFGGHYPRDTNREVSEQVMRQIVEEYKRALG